MNGGRGGGGGAAAGVRPAIPHLLLPLQSLPNRLLCAKPNLKFGMPLSTIQVSLPFPSLYVPRPQNSSLTICAVAQLCLYLSQGPLPNPLPQEMGWEANVSKTEEFFFSGSHN